MNVRNINTIMTTLMLIFSLGTPLASFAKEGFFVGIEVDLFPSIDLEYEDSPTVLDFESDPETLIPHLTLGYTIADIANGSIRAALDYQLIDGDYSIDKVSERVPPFDTASYSSWGLSVDYIYDFAELVGGYIGLNYLNLIDETDLPDGYIPDGSVYGLQVGAVFDVLNENINIDTGIKYYITETIEDVPNTNYTATTELNDPFIFQVSLHYYLF